MQETGKNDEALTSLLSLLKSNSSANDSENGESSSYSGSRAPRKMTTGSDKGRAESNSASKSLTIDDLRGFFHLPIVEVAKQLGTCTTALKKICRKNKIMKWPYRQIRSITKSIQSLEMASLNDTLPDDLKSQYREQIYELQKAIDEIVQDPNADVSAHLRDNIDLDGDDFEEHDHEGEAADHTRRFSAPSNSVMQIMQAAAATAGYESNSKNQSGSSNSKRKREDETAKDIKDAAAAPEVQPPSIGLTTVGVVSAAESYRNAYFVGPVRLAPLQRKKVKSTKKLVPLIEPDICNHYKMEFLPNSILHHSDKYSNKALESAIMAGYSSTSSNYSSAQTASSSSASDYSSMNATSQSTGQAQPPVTRPPYQNAPYQQAQLHSFNSTAQQISSSQSGAGN